MTSILNKFTGVIDRARRLEAFIASSVEATASRMTGSPGPRQPLEIVHAVVDAVARDIQPIGRGHNSFPFTTVRITLLAPTARARARLAAVVDGVEPLRDRIAARLGAAGCHDATPDVVVSYATRPRPDWANADFDVQLLRIDRAAESGAPPVRLDLKVIEGTAMRDRHSFAGGSIAIGRGTDIADRGGRLLRLNQVAFDEAADDISGTVSRLHAHIDYDTESRRYRLFDDGSAQGTSVVREGRGYSVLRGGPGLVLRSGDEIVLGRARLRVTIVP